MLRVLSHDIADTNTLI